MMFFVLFSSMLLKLIKILHHFVGSEKDLRYIGKILDGFSLASKPLSSKKVRIFFCCCC